MSHPIIHIEISAQDRQEAANFYKAIFGWETQDFPDMDYTTFKSGEGGIGGGFMTVRDDSPAGTVVAYIQTDDINATLSQIEAHGGKVLVPPMDIPGVGRFAHFSDPTGNLMAVLQPAPMEGQAP